MDPRHPLLPRAELPAYPQPERRHRLLPALQKEFAAADKGFTAVKHQREVGTGYFDAITQSVQGAGASTTALHGSTEDEQFFDAGKPAQARKAA